MKGKWGIINGVILAVGFTLLGYIYQDTIKHSVAGQIILVLGYVAVIVCLFTGITTLGENKKNKEKSDESKRGK